MEKNNSTQRRKLTGMVVSDKMQKTRVVEVVRLKKHNRYEKYYKVSTRFKAHDENNEYKAGDEVMIEESRPLSKDKKWRIVKLVRQVEIKPEAHKEETETNNSADNQL